MIGFFQILVATVCMICSNAYSASLSEMKVYGMSQIKDDQADMWDKKNDAVKNAKDKATLKLAATVLKPEALEEKKELIKKDISRYSSRYLISSEVQAHGPEESGDFKAYHARVLFKYSLENFKDLLKQKGFADQDFKRHKVAAFIEVLDLSSVRSYSWWRDGDSQLHPVLKPLQAKLAGALAEEGYELLPVRPFQKDLGLKQMASAMGAQYYVSGSVKISRVGSGYNVKGGLFKFHEALSQKLVSKVDLKKFGSSMRDQQREVASSNEGESETTNPPRSKDLLAGAFKQAAKKMNSIENVDHLNQGVAEISFSGVNNPVELKAIKLAIQTNLRAQISSLTERKIEKGRVLFHARTSLSPVRLLSMMNSQKYGLEGYRGVLKNDGKTLSFTSISSGI